jgi:hypothetical protein
VLRDEWCNGSFDQQPVEDDARVKSVEVLEFSSAETKGGGGSAVVDLGP